MPRGRKPLFDEKTQDWIIANPDQLSYSELAMKFSCSIQTIKRIIYRRGAYKSNVDAVEVA